MFNSPLWAGCGGVVAVGLVWVWLFVGVRSVGFLLASVSAFTSKQPRPRPTTPQLTSTSKSSLAMPFPELEAQAAQALLVAAAAAGDLPGMGPGAKPSVMAPKGQVRSLYEFVAAARS